MGYSEWPTWNFDIRLAQTQYSCLRDHPDMHPYRVDDGELSSDVNSGTEEKPETRRRRPSQPHTTLRHKPDSTKSSQEVRLPTLTRAIFIS